MKGIDKFPEYALGRTRRMSWKKNCFGIIYCSYTRARSRILTRFISPCDEGLM